ncbi:MAG: hypothetical protein QXZ48_09155 [Zestosphaera sp.]
MEVKSCTQTQIKGVVWCKKASKYHPIYRMDLVKVGGKSDTEWYGIINDKFIDFGEALKELLSRNGLSKNEVIIVVLDETDWGKTGE